MLRTYGLSMHSTLQKRAGWALHGSLAYSEVFIAACAAFRRDMPAGGTPASAGACGGGGSCTGACKLGWAVSSFVTPAQPPLLLGPCDEQMRFRQIRTQ